MIEFAEKLYKQNSSNTFGMTEDLYKFLIKRINEYDK